MNDQAPKPFHPLPAYFDMTRLSQGQVEGQITLMLAEVRNAILRHRKAWARMIQVRHDLEDDGRGFIDEERPYKLAVSDVKWWREEMEATSAALSALIAYSARAPRPTTPAERTPRTVLLGWDPDSDKPPTKSQYLLAIGYQNNLRKSNQVSPAGAWDLAQALIEAYEAARAHPPGAVHPPGVRE